jgi:hypothetical protein
MDIGIYDAVLAINPNAIIGVIDNDFAKIEWLAGTTPISKSDIQAKQAELQADYDSKQYQRDRKEEYNKLNQFEMQFDDQRDGTTTWVDAINGIKEKYPKE